MLTRNLIAAVLAITAFQTSAEEVHRSVDAEGNVTFSDAPVAGAVKSDTVRVDPGTPSPERQAESQQRAAEMIDAANVDQQQRDAASQKRQGSRAAAKQELKDAEAALEDARVVGEGDRRGTAGGGSRLTPEYDERVRGAEEDVERARQQLQEAK